MQDHIKPNKHIKNSSFYEQYECKICYEITDAPMRCAGSCRAVFCQHCITYTKNAADKCPLRCSDTFKVEPIPNLKMQYQCPFQPQQCKIEINSRQEFNSHYLKCKYVPQSYHQQMLRKKRFICNKGHKLYFLNKFVFQQLYEQENYINVYRLKCVGCGDQGTCPSICFECTTKENKAVYCVDCRIIPCSTFQCPIGHLLLGKNVGGYIGLKNSQICHMCGILPALVGERVSFDTLCGLVLCQLCHNTVPRQNQLIPLRHYFYDKQQEPFNRQLADFRRENQRAREQMLAEIYGQRERQSSEEEQSEQDSDSSERIRRFFRGEKINHSSSEEDSDDERQLNLAIMEHILGGASHQEYVSTGEQLSLSQRHENNSSSRVGSQLENHSSHEQNQQNEQQDQFFSIDSQPQNQKQEWQFFLCESWQNDSLQQISMDQSKYKPKDKAE